MVRLLRLVVLAVVAITLVTLAVANRGGVELHLLPAAMGDFLGLSWTIRLPLFLVIFGGILVGLLLGFVWEWLRAHSTRAEVRAVRRRADRLEREASAAAPTAAAKDDVLALLDRKAG